MTFQGAIGHDNENGLTDFNPQPMCDLGIQFPEFVHGGHTVYTRGAGFCIIDFAKITKAQYIYNLEVLGATDSLSLVSMDVTVSLPDHDRDTFNSYNAVFVHKKGIDTLWTLGIYERVSFKFMELEAI